MSAMSLTVRPDVASSSKAKLLKLVVFTIAGYRLGLPMSAVLRVVNCPEELHDRLSAVEFVPLGQHSISVLNLQRYLSLKTRQQTVAQGEFLVMTKLNEELCAIRVDAPPDLIEVDASMIRQLPVPYRQGHPLSIASCVAVLPQGKATLAIFLLDVRRVLEVLRKAEN